MPVNAHYASIAIGTVKAVTVARHHRREPSMSMELWSPRRGCVTVELPVTLATILRDRMDAALRGFEKDGADVSP